MNERESPQPIFSTGDVIAGKYRVEGVLGAGGMGIVLAAMHLDLDRRVAIKVMRSELVAKDDSLERLLLEGRLAARLRSEHVCQVLDVGTLPNGTPYLVMEHLEGSDLATVLERDGRFGVAMAVDLVMEACEAVAEAHAAHIVHRDLKPENLFLATTLDGSPTIKVLDFGISKRGGAPVAGRRTITNPSAALGSPHYMPPEQMRAAKDVDARADVWALGAILFELVTARHAFDGNTVPEVCAAVMDTEAPRASDVCADVPEALSNVIARCLQKAPEARFPGVLELARALSGLGSPRALASLRTIERLVATRARPIVTLSPCPGLLGSERELTPRSSTSPSLASKTSPLPALRRAEPPAAVLPAASRPKQAPWRRIALLSILPVAGLAALAVLDDGPTPPSPAGARAGLSGAPAVPTFASAPNADIRVTMPSPKLPAAGITETSAGAEIAPVRTSAPSLTPAVQAVRPPVTKSSGTAPAASSAPDATPNARPPSAAWDPNAFGPRR